MSIDPKIELHIRERNEVVRKDNDTRYAIKLVEKVVFGLVAMILVAFITALIALVIK